MTRSTEPGRRVQLHRALAKLGWGSRTQAWEWVRAGQVCVDGQVVTDPLTWVDLACQQITRGGKEAAARALLTLAMNKPRGVVTTRSDERGRRTVYNLLPPDLPWLFPVGRLDADSEGLLLFTSDAQLAVRLTEPAHRVPKTYQVTVRGTPAVEELAQLRNGVELSDGPTRPVKIRLLGVIADDAVVEMVLTEGRNRQIRRMWAALGRKVHRLVRLAVGNYQLGDLTPGATQLLSPEEVRLLTPLRPVPGTASAPRR